jgi:hypothetical protein
MQVYQYPRRKVPQDPKHIDWAAILVAGAGLYFLSQIKSNSEQSKLKLEQSRRTIQLDKRLDVPVAPKPEASQSNEPSLSPGSRKVLKYCGVGWYRFSGFLEADRGC